jgi:hypothetical protein
MYQELLKYEHSFQIMYPRQALWGNPDNENVVHSSKSYVACICYQFPEDTMLKLWTPNLEAKLDMSSIRDS